MIRILNLAVLIVLLAAKTVLAGGESSQLHEEAVVGDDPTGFRKEILNNVDGVEQKVSELTKAFPSDKWTYRPMEGVRSANEVVNHIAGSNYFFAGFFGVKPDIELKDDAEKDTNRDKSLAILKTSFEFLRNLVKGIKDTELDKKVKFFGGKEATQREVLLTTVTHMHEHLGQLIAYARVNGIVPPWSKGKD